MDKIIKLKKQLNIKTSEDLFGRENISAFIGFLIERWEKEKKKNY